MKLDFPNVDLVLKAVIGETEIQELLYVPSRKRILVRLSDKCGREGIEAFTPNLSAMTSLHDGSLCSSVTVTTKGKVWRSLLPLPSFFSFLFQQIHQPASF